MGKSNQPQGGKSVKTVITIAAAASAASPLLMHPSRAAATTIYSENFDEVPSNSTTAPATGYANFAQIPSSPNTAGLQIQGGSGGAGVSITGGGGAHGGGAQPGPLAPPARR